LPVFLSQKIIFVIFLAKFLTILRGINTNKLATGTKQLSEKLLSVHKNSFTSALLQKLTLLLPNGAVFVIFQILNISDANKNVVAEVCKVAHNRTFSLTV